MCKCHSDIDPELMKIISKAFKESEHHDSICQQMCPKLWCSQQRQAANGRFDVFSCKERFSTDMFMIRPYSYDELKAALFKHCKSANKSSVEWEFGGEICSGYERLKEFEAKP